MFPLLAKAKRIRYFHFPGTIASGETRHRTGSQVRSRGDLVVVRSLQAPTLNLPLLADLLGQKPLPAASGRRDKAKFSGGLDIKHRCILLYVQETGYCPLSVLQEM